MSPPENDENYTNFYMYFFSSNLRLQCTNDNGALKWNIYHETNGVKTKTGQYRWGAVPSLPEIIAMVIVINNNERLVVLKCWFVTMLQV